MEYLLGNKVEIERIKGEDKILLMMDFDGTISPIVEDPKDAVLPKETREVLEGLGENDHITLAVISGRGLLDLKAKVGIEGIIYVGNHGMEAEGIPPLLGGVSKRLEAMEEVSKILKEALGAIEGIIIEDKDLSISIHYRKADPLDEDRINIVVEEVIGPHKNTLNIFHGRKVVEVRPKGAFNKGDLARHLTNLNPGALPIYIGDDFTDEDAFRTIREDGITINARKRVEGTAARYYLDGPREVRRFLEFLV